MRRSLLLAVTAALMLFAVACGESSSPTQPVVVTPPAATPTSGGLPTATPTPPPTGGATHIVNVGPGNIFMDSSNSTGTTTIRTGDRVQWNFMDTIPHTTTSGNCCTPNGLWDSGLQTSGSFAKQFSTTGTFPYYCTVHGAMMTGTVVVN